MPIKTFPSSRIRQAHYDTASRQLDLHWDDKTVRAYKQVPEEVYRRLCSAPNPVTYWEDRSAEEYPWRSHAVAAQQTTRLAGSTICSAPRTDAGPCAALSLPGRAGCCRHGAPAAGRQRRHRCRA